jgi:hypothetical protein
VLTFGSHLSCSKLLVSPKNKNMSSDSEPICAAHGCDEWDRPPVCGVCRACLSAGYLPTCDEEFRGVRYRNFKHEIAGLRPVHTSLNNSRGDGCCDTVGKDAALICVLGMAIDSKCGFKDGVPLSSGMLPGPVRSGSRRKEAHHPRSPRRQSWFQRAIVNFVRETRNMWKAIPQ